MADAEETYYTEDRWQNWLARVETEEIDPENEDSARLLLNLQDDAAIAVAKIISAFEEGRLEAEEAVEELDRVRSIVLSEPDLSIENDTAREDKAILVDGVQTSLVCVFYAAEEYIAAGPAEEAPIAEYVEAAAAAEADDDMDAALGYLVQAGTRIIAGDDLDMSVVEEIEYGLVSEWVNGLDSLQSAMSDPEVVEEED
ncbi:hypothetical protein GCM10008995_27290 [Halobellus salinus]|uniref:DUF2150 family protein n=1 Tax=Halobellus salinus TaxID=931585 RepID=A0A830EJC4_9EURY|nr:DUF2150 family protein [Halobellus salinus]GGJ16004.1 hypothetical protein GCM10008995_27290 [Halobellus salinus]SMP31355.1 hypothetical protein SAMN06265347_1184 [Halobellus salinus]